MKTLVVVTESVVPFKVMAATPALRNELIKLTIKANMKCTCTHCVRRN